MQLNFTLHVKLFNLFSAAAVAVECIKIKAQCRPCNARIKKKFVT